MGGLEGWGRAGSGDMRRVKFVNPRNVNRRTPPGPSNLHST